MLGTDYMSADVLAQAIASTVGLLNTDGCAVAPIEGNFTPDTTLLYADIVWSTWSGSDPITLSPIVPAFVATDPVSGDYLFQLVPDSSPGFYWLCGSTPSPSKPVYGVGLYTNGTTKHLLGIQKFPNVINITVIGQVLDAAMPLYFRMPKAFFGS